MLQKQSEDIATEKRKTMESLKEELGLKVLKEEEKELDRLQTTTSGLLNEMNILKSEATIKKSELDLATKDLNRREEELVQMKVDLDNLKKNIQLRVRNGSQGGLSHGSPWIRMVRLVPLVEAS
ncbi:unnamed protein product [Nesidiocoris tenuis]|uniref:Uncharacterized protein n=1 Tax=Nesidiocoris tenuis TaxID=355587 RepID=A0A6H5GPH4_9HEMI|nr:unnamed protein product [Nesidiocoris tenuis]